MEHPGGLVILFGPLFLVSKFKQISLFEFEHKIIPILMLF